MTTSGIVSDQVREAIFHLPKAMDAEPNKKRGDTGARRQAGQAEVALPAQDAPAKAIDDSHHRIEGIHQTPRLGDDARAKADRRNVEAELHDERDDISEIPVLDVEGGDPQRW